MNINYHVHTPLCNHAVGTMTDYIRHAVSLGLSEICFLDHLTLNPADRGLSMSLSEVPLYFHTARLGRRFRDHIAVKVGLEIDFYPDAVACFEEITDRFDFDLIGSAVHFMGPTDIVTRHCDWRRGAGDTDAVYGLYYDVLDHMLDQNYFDMVCHFDLIKKFGRRPHRSFEPKIDDLLAKIKDRGLALELNTSGFGHPVKEPYPSMAILEKCRSLGIPLTLGSDAHRPAQLTNHYELAEAFLRKAGYKEICTFTRRHAVPIALTSTRKLETHAH